MSEHDEKPARLPQDEITAMLFDLEETIRPFQFKDVRLELDRELDFRRQVYPTRVTSKVMTEEVANHRRSTMRAAAKLLLLLETLKATRTGEDVAPRTSDAIDEHEED